eukprot:6421606-Prymnesium_polylepis.1
METWEVSPHQGTAARHRGNARAHARGTPGNSARRGCGQGGRRKSAQRRACGRQCDGTQRGSHLISQHRQHKCLRTRA